MNIVEKESVNTALAILVLLIVLAIIFYGADSAIKKATGGRLGLLGAAEVAVGGVVAYKLYNAFGSGGTTAIAADGTQAVTADAATAGADATAAGAADATAAGDAAVGAEGLGGAIEGGEAAEVGLGLLAL